MKRLPSSREKRMEALQQNRYLSGLDDEILDYLAQRTPDFLRFGRKHNL